MLSRLPIRTALVFGIFLLSAIAFLDRTNVSIAIPGQDSSMCCPENWPKRRQPKPADEPPVQLRDGIPVA
jgi:hypothetical protein